ncbi:MAG: phosphatidylserine decarboxylase [Clostridia bacterium]|nr:phosphatidylserine decarboxylase [Clostridia bacterium]
MKYRDRTGKCIEVSTKQDRFLARMYAKKSGRAVIRVLATRPVTGACRVFMNSPLSKPMIKSFVRKNHIDMSAYVPCKYRSYNAFFMRQIKPDQRTIYPDPNSLISPCDSKVSVYPIETNTHFTIKHTPYTVSSLLRDSVLAEKFAGGYCVVLRLTVDNYHRYAYAVSGNKSEQRYIKGIFHTVNPVANDYVPIYKENCREFCVIESELFGTVVQMEVGALMVGRIVNYAQEACSVVRGMEKGRFEFGGSTVVLLLEPGRVVMRRDLLENTKEGYETLIHMGEVLGRSTAAIDLGCETETCVL